MTSLGQVTISLLCTAANLWSTLLNQSGVVFQQNERPRVVTMKETGDLQLFSVAVHTAYCYSERNRSWAKHVEKNTQGAVYKIKCLDCGTHYNQRLAGIQHPTDRTQAGHKRW